MVSVTPPSSPTLKIFTDTDAAEGRGHGDGDLGHVDAGGVEVVDEDAVEQRPGSKSVGSCLSRFDDAAGVVAEEPGARTG